MKLKELKKKVMYYADILGVKHLVKKVSINKKISKTTDARTYLRIYLDKCNMEFAVFDDEIVIHEVLHLVFKNTLNFRELEENKYAKDTFGMIHEQELDRLAIALAKQFPYKEK